MRKSSNLVAALSCVSRIAARFRISGGSLRDFPVAKNRSVSAEANERITFASVNYLFITVKTTRRIDPRSGKVLARLTMPEGVGVSGLESNGADLFYAGGGPSGKVRAVRRPKQ